MNDVINEVDKISKQMNELSTSVKIALAASDHRLFKKNIIIGVLIALLVISNIGWFMYEKQFETVKETITTETTTETYTIDQSNETGDNNFIGKDGNITYGEAENNGN